jgi:pimeloyl-ACP methyl ester carboxylesterase
VKRVLRYLAITFLFVVVAAPLALWIGSTLSLDRDFHHSQATTGLDRFRLGSGASPTPALSLITTGAMTFRARTAGFGGRRGNVILLHGFPESSAMYLPMIPVLAKAGYQVVAFDQRGYSPGARPEGSAAYATDLLVADVFAVADAVGFERFHLVGHDWGAVVGWIAVFRNSPRIMSWSALSIPHMGAYAAAIAGDPDQQRRSAYVGFFRMPWLPEAVFSFNGFAMMRRAIYAEHGEEILDEYLAIFSEPGALTAALDWYRASDLNQRAESPHVRIPTAFIWGNRDPVVGDQALETQRQYFDGNLREIELDTGHWLMEAEPEVVTRAVLAHIDRVSD